VFKIIEYKETERDKNLNRLMTSLERKDYQTEIEAELVKIKAWFWRDMKFLQYWHMASSDEEKNDTFRRFFGVDFIYMNHSYYYYQKHNVYAPPAKFLLTWPQAKLLNWRDPRTKSEFEEDLLREGIEPNPGPKIHSFNKLQRRMSYTRMSLMYQHHRLMRTPTFFDIDRVSFYNIKSPMGEEPVIRYNTLMGYYQQYQVQNLVIYWETVNLMEDAVNCFLVIGEDGGKIPTYNSVMKGEGVVWRKYNVVAGRRFRFSFTTPRSSSVMTDFPSMSAGTRNVPPMFQGNLYFVVMTSLTHNRGIRHRMQPGVEVRMRLIYDVLFRDDYLERPIEPEPDSRIS